MRKYKDQWTQKIYDDCYRRLNEGLGETLKDHPKTTGKKPYLPNRIIETIWRGIHANLYPQQNWAKFRGTMLYGAFAAGRDWAKKTDDLASVTVA